MKTKVSELQGAALDWAVAHCEGLPIKRDPMGFKTGSEAGFWIWVWASGPSSSRTRRARLIGREYSPSTNWADGGPIIEREGIDIRAGLRRGGVWWADIVFPEGSGKDDGCGQGTTPLVAAMRCYVASKMGDEIEIPDELIQEA